MSEAMEHAMPAATTTAAALGVMALAGLLPIGLWRRRSPYWWPMVLWVAHAAAFFAVNVTWIEIGCNAWIGPLSSFRWRLR